MSGSVQVHNAPHSHALRSEKSARTRNDWDKGIEKKKTPKAIATCFFWEERGRHTDSSVPETSETSRVEVGIQVPEDLVRSCKHEAPTGPSLLEQLDFRSKLPPLRGEGNRPEEQLGDDVRQGTSLQSYAQGVKRAWKHGKNERTPTGSRFSAMCRDGMLLHSARDGTILLHVIHGDVAISVRLLGC